jgi:hypothetical protein
MHDAIKEKADELINLLEGAVLLNSRCRGILHDAFGEHREGCRGVSGENMKVQVYGFIEKTLGD